MNYSPGVQLDIGGVTSSICNNHREAYYWWNQWEIKDVCLFHIDAHSDMVDAASFGKVSKRRHKRLSNCNYISAGVHDKFVKNVIFHNPHIPAEDILWKTDPTGLYTKVHNKKVYWANNVDKERKSVLYGGGNIIDKVQLFFTGGIGVVHLSGDKVVMTKRQYDKAIKEQLNGDERELGEILSGEDSFYWSFGKEPGVEVKFKLEDAYTPMVLDIDLDAFACGEKYTVQDFKKDGIMESIQGWEARMDSTIDYLKKLPIPKHIVIARSQGGFSYNPFLSYMSRIEYVPKNLVDKIQNTLVEKLTDWLEGNKNA